MKGQIVAGILSPHPPHLVYAENPPQNEPKAECGWEELRWGYERLRKVLEGIDYDAIIVHTPHWLTRTGHHVLCVPHLKSLSVDPIFPNLFRYHYDLKVDCDLAEILHSEIENKKLPTKLMKNKDFRVDYGTIISGHLVNPKWDKPIVALSASTVFFDYSNDVGQDEMIRLGEATRTAVEKSGKKVVLLASTSLSHRHFTEEPALPEDMSFEHVYNHNQYVWDMQVIRLMREGKSRELIDVMPDFIEQSVSECKTGSLTWLMAGLGFPTYPATIHAYGSVIGTGNAVASWLPEGRA